MLRLGMGENMGTDEILHAMKRMWVECAGDRKGRRERGDAVRLGTIALLVVKRLGAALCDNLKLLLAMIQMWIFVPFKFNISRSE